MTEKGNHMGFANTVLFLCIGVIVSCVFLDISLIYGFAISIVITSIILFRNGFALNEQKTMFQKGIKECMLLYVMILLIGATVSIWLSSGVVPAMIHYGFEYMKGINFLFAAFLIISFSALFMGTALGTVSTIGVVVLGIGKGFGIPSSVLVGVIVSGAFIADKISPISGLLNLTLTASDANYKEASKSMLHTLLPTFIITAAIYYLIGLRYTASSDTSSIIEFQRAISNGFSISPYLLLMPVVILLMSFLGVKIIYSILAGLSGGIAISYFVQEMSVVQILKAIILGYRGNTSSSKLNDILLSGGVVSMLEVVLIVMGAVALASLLEGSGLISFFTSGLVENIKSKKELILKTGFLSGMLTIVTCDQTMGVILPGRLLKKKYRELKVSENILVRTISDTGTIIAPLMPWNINSLIIGIVAGISAVKYAPFAVLCYISPLITIFYAIIKFNTNNNNQIRLAKEQGNPPSLTALE
jgi:Na+:H+ antiporter, NhaC family